MSTVLSYKTGKKRLKFTALHSALGLFKSLKSFGENKETILSISEKIWNYSFILFWLTKI